MTGAEGATLLTKVERRLDPPHFWLASPAHFIWQLASGAETDPLMKPSPQ